METWHYAVAVVEGGRQPRQQRTARVAHLLIAPMSQQYNVTHAKSTSQTKAERTLGLRIKHEGRNSTWPGRDARV
jgi:hypothetical protein